MWQNVFVAVAKFLDTFRNFFSRKCLITLTVWYHKFSRGMWNPQQLLMISRHSKGAGTFIGAFIYLCRINVCTYVSINRIGNETCIIVRTNVDASWKRINFVVYFREKIVRPTDLWLWSLRKFVTGRQKTERLWQFKA